MRITRNNSSMAVALRVIKHVKVGKKDSIIINPYVNGREKGLFMYRFDLHEMSKNSYVRDSERAVSFAENRNSDDIIVQFGILSDFTDLGVFKSEEKYKTNKAYFRYDDYESAGRFISGWLNGLVRKVELNYQGKIVTKKGTINGNANKRTEAEVSC